MQYLLSTAATGTDGSRIIDPGSLSKRCRPSAAHNNSRPRKEVGCFAFYSSPFAALQRLSQPPRL